MAPRIKGERAKMARDKIPTRLERSIFKQVEGYSMNTFRLAITVVALTVAGLAHAGKTERDFYAKEGEPAIKKATETLKASCGCDVKIEPQMSTLPTVDHIKHLRDFAADITQSAPGYCSDAPSKAAICQMKAIEIVGSEKSSGDFTFANGKATSTVTPYSHANWKMMVKLLDK